MDRSPAPVIQLRLVVEADDYDAAVRFYRDVLGMPEELAVAGPNGARVTILDAGGRRSSWPNGRQVARRLRVAFEVADAAATTERLVEAGATLVAPPTACQT